MRQSATDDCRDMLRERRTLVLLVRFNPDNSLAEVRFLGSFHSDGPDRAS